MISESAVSRALVREDEGIQKSVYYASHSINDQQTRYQRLEKLVLFSLHHLEEAQALFPDFPITVLIEHHLTNMVENSKANGRISK